jgi:glucose-6-phosphate 1-epimerase
MLEYKNFANGFQYIEVNNDAACARIALQGAHVFHYQPVMKSPLLWLSTQSCFETGRAIRGGIPICWPWFGKHPENSSLPQHGFARTSLWELLETKEINAQTTEVTLRLQSSSETLQLWPYQFELVLVVTVGQTLSLALTTRNCDPQSFMLTEALHTYFAVSNIKNVMVSGFADTSYLDTVISEEHVQEGTLVIGQEVDRIYQQVEYPVRLHDQNRIIQIDAQGSGSAVIWNPWIEKCRAMADMQDDGYQTMICIETVNALDDARLLTSGEEHTLRAVLSIEV